jgi:hypothetical protein
MSVNLLQFGRYEDSLRAVALDSRYYFNKSVVATLKKRTKHSIEEARPETVLKVFFAAIDRLESPEAVSVDRWRQVLECVHRYMQERSSPQSQRVEQDLESRISGIIARMETRDDPKRHLEYVVSLQEKASIEDIFDVHLALSKIAAQKIFFRNYCIQLFSDLCIHELMNHFSGLGGELVCLADDELEIDWKNKTLTTEEFALSHFLASKDKKGLVALDTALQKLVKEQVLDRPETKRIMQIWMAYGAVRNAVSLSMYLRGRLLGPMSIYDVANSKDPQDKALLSAICTLKDHLPRVVVKEGVHDFYEHFPREVEYFSTLLMKRQSTFAENDALYQKMYPLLAISFERIRGVPLGSSLPVLSINIPSQKRLPTAKEIATSIMPQVSLSAMKQYISEHIEEIILRSCEDETGFDRVVLAACASWLGEKVPEKKYRFDNFPLTTFKELPPVRKKTSPKRQVVLPPIEKAIDEVTSSLEHLSIASRVQGTARNIPTKVPSVAKEKRQHLKPAIRHEKKAKRIDECVRAPKEALHSPKPQIEYILPEVTVTAPPAEDEGEGPWEQVSYVKKRAIFSQTPEQFFATFTLHPRVEDQFSADPNYLKKPEYQGLSNKIIKKILLCKGYPGIITYFNVKYGKKDKWGPEEDPHYYIFGELSAPGMEEPLQGFFTDCFRRVSQTDTQLQLRHHGFTCLPYSEAMALRGKCGRDILRKKAGLLNEDETDAPCLVGDKIPAPGERAFYPAAPDQLEVKEFPGGIVSIKDRLTGVKAKVVRV